MRTYHVMTENEITMFQYLMTSIIASLPITDVIMIFLTKSKSETLHNYVVAFVIVKYLYGVLTIGLLSIFGKFAVEMISNML